MDEIILKGHKVSKGQAEGEALVTTQAISFFVGVNPETGLVTDKAHELDGVSLKGKIVLFPEEKGSVGGAFQLLEMVRCQTAPKALINRRAGSVVAVGAIVSNIPMVDKLKPDPFKVIETGDYIYLDADRGVVKVIKNRGGKHGNNRTAG